MEASKISTYLSLSTNKSMRDKIIAEFGTEKLNNCTKCSKNSRSFRDSVLYKPCYLTKECNIKAFVALQNIMTFDNVSRGDSDKIKKAISRAIMLGMEVEIKAPWVLLRSDVTHSYSVINLNSLLLDTRKYSYVKLGKDILLGQTTDGGIVVHTDKSLGNLAGDLTNVGIYTGKMRNVYKNIVVCTAVDKNNIRYIVFIHSSGRRILTLYTEYTYVQEINSGYYIELHGDNVIKLDKEFNIERIPSGIPVINI